MRRITIAMIVAAVLAVAGAAVGMTALTTLRSTSGGVPGFMAYRGLLVDATSAPVKDGDYKVTFRLYEAPLAVDHVWEETRMVTTAGGYFSVFLGDIVPLSPDLFQAGGIYLGIQIAGDKEMQPRQRLASVPFAMKAADSDTVGGQKPGDFATTDHTHNGTATADADVVQLRVSGECGPGHAIRAVLRDGTVVCETVGGVPATTPAPGPTPTPIPGATPAPAASATPVPGPAATATPTPAPTATPAGGFTPSRPGTGLVTATQLCDLQRTMAATIPGYQVSLDCTPPTLTVVDGGSPATVCVSEGWAGSCLESAPGLSHVGGYASMAIGDDGIPVVAYRDQTLDTLRVARCDDRRCTAAQVYVVDTIGPRGGFISLALRSDGRPVIAYMLTEPQPALSLEPGPRDVLKLAVCANQQCSSVSVVVVDAGGPGIDAGRAASLALLPGDLPVISYQRGGSGAGALTVARCLDPACSAADINTVESYDGGAAGVRTSIAIGSDGNPLIAYHKDTTLRSGGPREGLKGPREGLKVAHCHDPVVQQQ